ncbi:inositol 2-dehydrogenase [Fulvitalea axinellae]|uniref:Inositol 2-dehydrogenase n=1 Tax=Fulvitalea axinellae TaxID=1182444 RepID=A0AAU9CWY7_9BACT|nr:inositol 2-dehydrogenase [Fulvitalea axinellae]
MKKLTVGIAGVGRIGKIHLENLARKFSQVTVKTAVDAMEAGREYARSLGVENVTDNIDDLINDPEIDAVIVCSPTDTHAEYTMAAARAGKHVFCEKPLDLSLDTVKEVLAVVEEAGVKLMIGFNRRFDGNFMKIRELVEAGKVGEPHILKITSRDPGPPPVSYVKVSGGMFMDMTIHDFDMARFIVGSEVKEVYATAGCMVDPEIGEAGDVDTALVTLTFENGAMGVIDNSRKAVYGYDQRVEVFGTEGMANTDNNHYDNHRFYGAGGINAALPLNFFMDRYIDAYYNEMEAFVTALEKGEDMPVSGKDGIMSMAIGLAAKKSVEEKRPVAVSEILG